MGRIDFQVKVNGFRIELGEIESVAAEAEGVREAVAVVREDVPGLKRIVVYVTGTADSAGVVSACSARLPQYMVPSAVVVVEEWPRTSSDKIDRKRLPAPVGADGTLSGGEFVAPVTEVEVWLAGHFASVLGLADD